MIDEVADYLDASDRTSFRLACEQADMQTFHDVRKL